MIADLADVEPPRPEDPQPDPAPRLEHLGRVNDLAYGAGDAFVRMLGHGPADPRSTYIAHHDGEPAASVVTLLDGEACSVHWVATTPDARGRGLAPGLMRHALADGRERGARVTTLQATKMGRPVHERLGYRSLGTIEMWERRRPADG